MSEKFEMGQVVVLRSDGPDMTVVFSNPDTTSCVWFDNLTGKYATLDFKTGVLIKKS